MQNTENPISWYEITKDIIIPILSIAATLIIGILIALILKRREEKGKSKQLLLDTYMDYINRRIHWYSYKSDCIMYDMYNDMYNNYSEYFDDHANSHLAKESVKLRMGKYLHKLENYDKAEVNWTFFAIKFRLLLGREEYDNEAKGLERSIDEEINSEQTIMNFLLKLRAELKANYRICENINASNKGKIEYGLDMIESHIGTRFKNYQLQIFKPYDDKVADLISEF